MGYLGTKPANSPLTSELIPDGLIGTSDLANNAVTSDKILANAVTEAKLQSGLYTAKAWVNFNGTGTVAIRASGNVSSITDNGTGDYTVNFTTALADANYATTIGARRSSGNFDNRVTTQSLATSSVRLSSVDAGGTVVDFDTIQIAVHR